MKKLFITLIILITAITVFSQQHKLITKLLGTYVKNGLVNYGELKKDGGLNKYLDQLTSSDPHNFSRSEKLAFWINVYNAFTLKVIIDNYPIESINELHTGGRIIGHLLGKTVWDKEFITINKKKYSLNDVEHKILRNMDEPRIHFAIVCASISCPELRNEAFEADKINEQLQDQAIRFMNNKNRNSFDLKNRKAHLSKIFDWFDEDFGNTEEKILVYVSQFLPDIEKVTITNNLSEWEVSFKDYNWNLNEIK